MSIFDGLNSLPGFKLLFGSPVPMESPSLRPLDITYLQGRIIAVGRPWNRHTEKGAKRNNIDELGKVLDQRHKHKYLLLNLSVQSPFEKYQLGYQVLDCDLDVDPTLEKIFRLCQAVKAWLDMDPQNVLVVCCNSGVHASRLFIACYLVYSGDFANTYESLEYFYSNRVKKQMLAMDVLSKSNPSVKHFLNLFQSVIFINALPQPKPVKLFMILLDKLPLISAADNSIIARPGSFFSLFEDFDEGEFKLGRPIVNLYVFNKFEKKLVYSSCNNSESIMHWDPKQGKLLMKVEMELYGDLKLEVEFPNNSNKFLFTVPLHTGFLQKNGVHTLDASQLDSQYRKVLPEGFKVELVIQPHDTLPEDMYTVKYSHEIAMETLTSLHSVRPDPSKLDEMCSRGYEISSSVFALQRANNDLFDGVNFLRGLVRTSPQKIRSGRKSIHETKNEQPAGKPPLSPFTSKKTLTKNVSSDLSPFLREKFGHGLSSPGQLTPKTREGVDVPYVEDEVMTNELDKMLNELAVIQSPQSVAKKTPKKEAPPINVVKITPKKEASHVDLVKTPTSGQRVLKRMTPLIDVVGNHPKVHTTLSAEDNQEYDKFRKMLKMGVHAQAVILKIKSEGKDPERIEELKPFLNVVVTQNVKTANRPKSRRKNLHWEAVPENRLDNSIWKSRSSLSPSQRLVHELESEIDELESLFVENSENIQRCNKITSKIRQPSLLDSRRNQNISIGLAKLKIRPDVLCKALVDFDDTVLTFDVLQVINSVNMVPNTSELRNIKNFRGKSDDLSPAEQFIFKVAKKVTNADARVSAMLFANEFESRAEDLTTKMDIVRSACDEIVRSQKLKRLFQVVLLVGNKLNSEGNGSIQGFTVASLLKLSQTKSFNKSTTILDYIVSFASKRIPEVLRVQDDLASLSQSKNIDIVSLTDEINSLRNGLQELFEAIRKAGGDNEGANKLAALGSNAQETVSLLTMKLDGVTDSYCDLLEYFAEDPDLPMKEFFNTLHTFCLGLISAVKDMKAAEERKSRIPFSNKSSSYKVRSNRKPSLEEKPLRKAKSATDLIPETNYDVTPEGFEDGVKPLSATPNLKRFLENNNL